MRSRWYDPALGAWLTRDPAGYADGMCLYRYVKGNPLVYFDPFGMQAWYDQALFAASDFFAGAADSLSFGITDAIREAIGVNDAVDKSSVAYAAGEYTEMAVELAVGAGALKTLGKEAAEQGAKLLAKEGAEASSKQAAKAAEKEAIKEGGEAAAKQAVEGAGKEGEGIIYKRTHPETGEPYIGRADNAKNYEARQKFHDRKEGVKHDYEVVDRGEPGRNLRMKEETHIRQNGGPKTQGGNLANKRYEINEEAYRDAGGTADKPTCGRP
ncbi:MAG: hypothetical protein NFW05_06180 [Candidatus Accumulibacter sp.]|nr:hypothetical protein [Accumulibacter sp.]